MKTNFFHNRPKQKNNTFQQLLKAKRETVSPTIDLTEKETAVILQTADKCDPDHPLKMFKEGYIQGVRGTVKNYSAVLLLCLKDKFGFTSEQLQDVALHMDETFDCVTEGYLSLDDIVQTLKEEDGLDVRFNKTI